MGRTSNGLPQGHIDFRMTYVAVADLINCMKTYSAMHENYVVAHGCSGLIAALNVVRKEWGELSGLRIYQITKLHERKSKANVASMLYTKQLTTMFCIKLITFFR